MTTHNDCPHYLVPTNFGYASRNACRTVIGWSQGAETRVTLLHVADPLAATGLDAIGMLHAAAADQLGNVGPARRIELQNLADRLHPEVRSFVDLKGEWRRGNLVDELVRFAEEQAIDAIVLGARRWRFPWRTSLGQKLARHTKCQIVQVYVPGRVAAPATSDVVASESSA